MRHTKELTLFFFIFKVVFKYNFLIYWENMVSVIAHFELYKIKKNLLVFFENFNLPCITQKDSPEIYVNIQKSFQIYFLK